MQKVKTLQQIYKNSLKISQLKLKTPKFQFTNFSDPLDVSSADPTTRHYGYLKNVNINMDELFHQTTPTENFINAYRKYGHFYANIDPLGKISRQQEFVSPLDFGLSYKDSLEGNINEKQTNFLNSAKNISELEEQLKQIYTNTVAVEFDHIQNTEMKNWVYKNFEEQMIQKLSDVEKRNIHSLLVQTEAFDHYLHKKFNTFKRYSGEGVESSISALKTMLAKASEQGVKEAVIGIPHRGRLNVLCNILDYPPDHIFRKIKGFYDMPLEFYNGIDDVVSHIAVSKTKRFTGTGCKEQPINVSMLHNPSHLELINPSSMGKVRAKQDSNQDLKSVLNIQLHGDAAFTAQGVVYETFAVSGVPKFSIGGTIHIIVNNQIGYTTSVKDSRGHFYCSDIGKTYSLPIIHVNSDDPEAIQRVVKFAVLFRQKFQKDIIIDLIGYRKYGHNELDEPEYTQPQYYKHIRKIQKTLPQLYNDKLVKENVIKPDVMGNLQKKVNEHLESCYQKMSNEQGRPLEEYTSENAKGQSAFTKKWRNMTFSTQGICDSKIITGLNKNYLKKLGQQTTTYPPDFKVHPRLKKFFLDDRNKQIENNSIDWATAEAISISSLLQQGYNVRLSGEDVERGTFSQRHWVLVDQETEQEWNPLKDISESMNKGNLYVCNSPLSESAVLSYEYGYSLESPDNLSMWEAQFGDFFNCAQTTFDTLMLQSEQKWGRQSGLVAILPHGLDGAGPEHSSCRIERFLQGGNTDGVNREFEYKSHDPNRSRCQLNEKQFYSNYQDVNFCLVQPTTPANYYHVLRRQMLRNYRKPLIIAGPKTLLRNPQCKSTFEEMDEGTKFLPILQHGINSENKVVICCSGKIQYQLKDLIKQNSLENKVGLLILEELLPFPEELITQVVKDLNKDTKFIWAQEEQLNQGGFLFSEPHFYRILKNSGIQDNQLHYIGRRASAVPAIGVTQYHKKEQELLFQEILNKTQSFL